VDPTIDFIAFNSKNIPKYMLDPFIDYREFNLKNIPELNNFVIKVDLTMENDYIDM
jgi:hypothetical protein